MDRRRTGKLGMTVMEAMMAVFILAMGVAGIAGLIVQTVKLTDMARAHYVAVNIGKNRLERARVMPYSDLESLIEDKTRVNVSGDPDVAGDYRRTTTVTNVTENLKELVVTVAVWDRVNLVFTNESEIIRSLYTEYTDVNEE